MEFAAFQFVPIVPWLFTEKRVAPSFLHLIRFFNTLMKSPLSLLQDEQTWNSEPLLLHQMLQSVNYFCSAVLHFLQCIPVYLVLGEPRIGSSTPDMSHQSWAEWKDHLMWPVGNAFPNAAQAFAARMHCWLMFSWFDASTPGPALQSCFLVGLPPVLL